MISRRDFLKIAGVGAGGVILQGCAPRTVAPWLFPSPTSLPTETPEPTATRTATSTPTLKPTRTPIPTFTATNTPTPTAWPTEMPTDTETATAESGEGRLLCFVLWDHQLAQYGYQPRNIKKPVPETCPLRSGANNRLTPAWVDYWRGILQLCNPGMGGKDFEASWRSLVSDARAFTNGAALIPATSASTV
jgi:hypothetical protein